MSKNGIHQSVGKFGVGLFGMMMIGLSDESDEDENDIDSVSELSLQDVVHDGSEREIVHESRRSPDTVLRSRRSPDTEHGSPRSPDIVPGSPRSPAVRNISMGMDSCSSKGKSDRKRQGNLLSESSAPKKKRFECPICRELVCNLPRHLRSRKHLLDAPLQTLSMNPLYKKKKDSSKREKTVCCNCNVSVLASGLKAHLRKKHNITNEPVLKEQARSCMDSNFEAQILHISKQPLVKKPSFQPLCQRMCCLPPGYQQPSCPRPCCSATNTGNSLEISGACHATSQVGNVPEMESRDISVSVASKSHGILSGPSIAAIGISFQSGSESQSIPTPTTENERVDPELNAPMEENQGISNSDSENPLNSPVTPVVESRYPPMDTLIPQYMEYTTSLSGGNLQDGAGYARWIQEMLKFSGTDMELFTPDHIEKSYINVQFNLCKKIPDGMGNLFRPKKPSSVRTKLYAIKSFVKFVELNFNPNIPGFKTWKSRLSTWVQNITRECKRFMGEQEIEKRNKMLLPSFYREYRASHVNLHHEIGRYQSVTDTLPTLLLRDKFNSYRDYLILCVLTENSSRAATILDFTLQYMHAGWDRENGNLHFYVPTGKTLHCKGGAPTLSFQSDLVPVLKGYMKVREQWLQKCKPSQFVFCTNSGNQMKHKGLSNILTKGYNSVGFQGHVHSNMLRYMMATETYNKAPDMRGIVASHMGHSSTTQEKFYVHLNKQAAGDQHLATMRRVYVMDESAASATVTSADATESVVMETTDSVAGSVVMETNQIESSGIGSLDSSRIAGPSIDEDEGSGANVRPTKRIMKRVAWNDTHLDRLREIFRDFIKNQKCPTLHDLRQLLSANNHFLKRLARDRDVNLDKGDDVKKLEYAVLSRVKMFIKEEDYDDDE